MVEDPIAKVRFPKFAAAAKLEQNGKTIYFIDELTLREFQKRTSETHSSTGELTQTSNSPNDRHRETKVRITWTSDL